MFSMPTSTSPSILDGNSASSRATTPPNASEMESSKETKEIGSNDIKTGGGQQFEKLKYLLNQSSIYSKIISEKMERERAERRAAQKREERATEKSKLKESAPEVESVGSRLAKAKGSEPVASMSRSTRVNKRKAMLEDVLNEEDLKKTSLKTNKNKRAKISENTEEDDSRQPALVTGATLRDYQLAGVEWLVTLYENGLNGILADEMGLGKTLQTIAFLAHLREKGVWGPFLIVCPLSTLANWINEFERFTPEIPVVMYHGSPAERAEMRSTRLSLIGKNVGRPQKKGRQIVGDQTASSPETFPIVITTYELVMKDRNHLNRFAWKYIVVDESHRLKNMDCKLIQELKTYQSANRLLLTGTPLHNNLSELWSLLNFILPDIFDNLDSFQRWFDISDVGNDSIQDDEKLNQVQTIHILNNLHSILKPFMLRRLKAEVEKDLPPKKEYLLSAPLTHQQKDLYDAVVNRQLRSYLIEQKTARMAGETSSPVPSSPNSVVEVDSDEPEDVKFRRQSKRSGPKSRKSYTEKSDRKFFQEWDQNDEKSMDVDDNLELVGKAHSLKVARKTVNAQHLQNMVMQLRKVCNHPWLFDWPIDEATGQSVVNDDLMNASGKMLLVNRLLTGLFEKGHKVLVFSQFTSQLNLIEEWAEDFKGWPVCRIDGSTSQEDRRTRMKLFNESTADDAPKMFLLSTRAGGVGINLVAADTVILFDSDWNPQMDLQAQDRAHRIGQTKPVLVFRFVAANTIESHILKRAGAKRKLEALVIGQGNFHVPGESAANILSGKGKKQASVSHLAEVLLGQGTGEATVASKDDELLSDEQLSTLLDRSSEAMEREEGWSSKPGEATTGFEVYTTKTTGNPNDVLANLMQEDDE